MHHLTFSGLTCTRGDYPVFADLDAEWRGGGGILITGPNGCGKTSLLRMIAGLLEPVAGTIRLDNRAMGAGDLALNSLYCAATHNLKADLTLFDNLAFFAALYGYSRGTIDRAIDDLGLQHVGDIPLAQLSAGMQRRAGLARLAIARHAAPGQRPIWLLDEPEDSLDTDSMARLARLLDAHHADGGLSVIASHHKSIDTYITTTFEMSAKQSKDTVAA